MSWLTGLQPQQSFGCVHKPLVSVLTPTVPGREHLLAEAAASVQAQTLDRWEHLIWLDTEREGCSVTVNKLAAVARGEWLLILADDDLLLPGCLEKHLECDGDIVYSKPLVWGEDPAQFHCAPPFIPSCSLIRKELWDRVGGYDEGADHTEDRIFYEEATARGASFVECVYPCWVYRFWGGNKSR